ncbi:Uu.00g094290.m01.CDS01 [Anthostomella pinea]|uniref:Uu.00g094290.m01.CDS01 n=1 Tax=Anthostomella pinea TaxID=933095 RepID=A0AAI8VI59_9PEZI|nr:Uu.00g094290.m01.CDS01 [Anthostomella pinea]
MTSAAQEHGAAPVSQAEAGITPTFPPVRACLFDMDGLLINTEDLYTKCADIVLEKYGRPGLPWDVKAQLMGIPGASNGDTFHNWAQLPISRQQFFEEQSEQQRIQFPECQPLPGVQKLLENLKKAETTSGQQVHIALATSSERRNYDIKTSRPGTKAVLDIIPEEHRVLGDDPRVKKGRGKPAPDIYLLALKSVNDSLPEGTPQIFPRECLVFEDSVLGVEAGRRAGMRVVWVPHARLAEVYKGQEAEVLAARIALCPIGDEHQLGEVGDGWADQLPSLEDFPYERYGIVVS